MPVHVSDRALKNSFVRLIRDASVINGPSAHLLSAYGVECGLKAVLLRRTSKQSTSSLATSATTGSTGHDLRALAKELNIARSIYVDLERCQRTDVVPTATIAPNEVHQAWRYGATLDARDQARFVAGLNGLTGWCRQELKL